MYPSNNKTVLGWYGWIRAALSAVQQAFKNAVASLPDWSLFFLSVFFRCGCGNRLMLLLNITRKIGLTLQIPERDTGILRDPQTHSKNYWLRYLATITEYNLCAGEIGLWGFHLSRPPPRHPTICIVGICLFCHNEALHCVSGPATPRSTLHDYEKN